MIILFVDRASFGLPEYLAIFVRIPVIFGSGFQQFVLLLLYRSLHLYQLKPFVIQVGVFPFRELFWLSQDCFNSSDFWVGSSL